MYIERNPGVLLVLISITIFFIVLGSRVNYFKGDAYGSLWVSESIIDAGTIRMDRYGDLLDRFTYQVVEENGHYYNLFPLGTPVFSIPVVAIVKLFGGNMVDDEFLTQKFICLMVAIGLFLMLYRIGRLFLSDLAAIGISAVFWFGTSFSSVLGTALWSQNIPTLIALFAIYHAIYAYENKSNINWIYLGVLLFFVYFCRPPFSLLSPVLLLFVATYSWRRAFGAGIVLATLLCIFFVFWYQELGKYLPDYYKPTRLTAPHFWKALAGVLVSPSRGLLVFSPFLWIPIITANRWVSSAKAYWRYGVFVLWPVLLLLVISTFHDWYGGCSYGPRYMSDVLPGIYVTYVIFLKIYFVKPRRLTKLLLIVTAMFSVYVHVYKGMYDTKITIWNTQPDVNVEQSVLFDWEYPQFLHNSLRQEGKIEKYGLSSYPVYKLPARFNYDDYGVVWGNWKDDGRGYLRHSYGRAYIAFNLADQPRRNGEMVISLDGVGHPRVKVALNNNFIREFTLGDMDNPLILKYSPEEMHYGAVNILSFELPDARKFPVNTKDSLSLYLNWIEFR